MPLRGGYRTPACGFIDRWLAILVSYRVLARPARLAENRMMRVKMVGGWGSLFPYLVVERTHTTQRPNRLLLHGDRVDLVDPGQLVGCLRLLPSGVESLGWGRGCLLTRLFLAWHAPLVIRRGA